MSHVFVSEHIYHFFSLDLCNSMYDFDNSNSPFFQVGAPPETVNLLNEILHGNDLWRNNAQTYCLGEDPELDEFMVFLFVASIFGLIPLNFKFAMLLYIDLPLFFGYLEKETYCEVLSKYKLDLAKPYDEATTFLSNMESQLSNLRNNTFKDLGYLSPLTFILLEK